MVNVTKKDIVQKHFCCSLLWLPDKCAPLWNRQLHIVLEPLTVTKVGVGNQALYFVADAVGWLLVRAI